MAKTVTASRSTFYVDTPPADRDPPLQRHSMYVTQPDLDRDPPTRELSSSSTTLPSSSGSVDRLTEKVKKKRGFFTLRPKSSFSLRPLFSSSTSLFGGKDSKKRDSYVQTIDETTSEVGVQTHPASTVDVPVQTCSEWAEGVAPSYRQVRPTYRRWPSAENYLGFVPRHASESPVGPSKDPARAKSPTVAPLLPSRLLKYAAPVPPLASTSASNCQSGESPVVASSANVPVQLSGKDRDGASSPRPTWGVSIAQVHAAPPTPPVRHVHVSDPNETLHSSDTPPSLVSPSPDDSKPTDNVKTEASPTDASKDTTSQEVSARLNHPFNSSPSLERPTSALKLERTDSPVKKTVHFELLKPDSKQVTNSDSGHPNAQLPRNLDDEFFELLKNLDIITEDPALSDLKTSSETVPVSRCAPEPKLFFPSPVPSFDVLRDFLAPIPETPNESSENDASASVNEPVLRKNDQNCEPNIKKDLPLPSNVEEFNVSTSPTHQDLEKIETAKDDSREIASSSTPITSAKSDEIADGNRESVYGASVSKNIEQAITSVSLPTLPSFFESPPKYTTSRSVVVNFVPEPDSASPITDPPSFVGETTEENMLSRSSSRSSIRSNPTQEFNDFMDSAKRFDSCDNLAQLEDEIIRSLCQPDDDSLDEIDVIEFVPISSEPSKTTLLDASQFRRNILDRLISSETEESVSPPPKNNSHKPSHKRTESPRNKITSKRGKKYVATLTKMEHHDTPYESYLSQNDERAESPASSVCSSDYSSQSVLNDGNEFSVNAGESSIKTCPVDNEMATPVKSSAFPETNTAGIKTHSPVTASKTNNTVPSVPKALYTNNMPSPPSVPLEKINDKLLKNEDCDFTHCLRPSKIHNTSFLAKMNATPMTYHPIAKSPDPTETRSYDQKPQNANTNSLVNHEPQNEETKTSGQCDYGNCLKPSQVHNSIFTAELSEITANKSSSFNNEGLRSNSPFPASRSPVPSFDSAPRNAKTQNDDIKHKSEISITLQAPQKTQDPQRTNQQTSSRTRWIPPVQQPTAPDDSNKRNTAESPKEHLVEASSPCIPLPPPLPPKKNVRENDGNTNNLLKNRQVDRDWLQPSGNSIESSVSKGPGLQEIESQSNPENRSEMYHSSESEDEVSPGNRYESTVRSPTNYSHQSSNTHQNGTNGYGTSFSNGRSNNSYLKERTNSPKRIITDAPPPVGAVLVDQRVTVDGDRVHTDKYYALPIKEVLRETTSTTKFIPAPPKYEGIGPTEDGIPIGLRNSVKEENKHNWYKTMYKSLHKADLSNDGQEYIIGYTSEPEMNRKDKSKLKKSSTLDNRYGHTSPKTNGSLYEDGYPASTRSSIEVYNVRPRLIEDYEPGESSVTDDQNTTGSKRFLPPMNAPKTSYEFKNGYEPENHFIRNLDQPDALSYEQQRVYYKEIQRGGEIPQYGLGKPAPLKHQEPTVGPLPPPPLNYHGPVSPQATRPLTLPANYPSPNSNHSYQSYEIEMKQTIHTETHQSVSPSSSQLSSPSRIKSPCRSPDLKIPARALFDFKPESSKEIPLRKGDFVLVLRQLDKNWYEGERQSRIGIFPVSYVEIVPPEQMSTPVKIYNEGVGKVLFDFKAQTSVELSVRKGDTITLLRRVDDNWYEARFNSIRGIIPTSYILVLTEPTEKPTRSHSPNRHPVSPRNSSEIRISPVKPNLNSTSPYLLTNSISPPALTSNRGKVQSRRKKGSGLIEPVMYRALYNYSPQNSDELELKEGDSIYIVEMCDDGWYVGTSVRTGVFGIFPGNYVEKV